MSILGKFRLGRSVKAASLELFARSLLKNRNGASVIEFALVLPILVALGMYGTEIAYMASIHMQVSQIALSLADNASRMEQTNNSNVAPTVTEADVNAVMKGAILSGGRINFAQNGRLILSSLEKDPVSGKQFIHWQRCTGGLLVPSAYGNDTTANGLNGPILNSMGSGSTKAQASGAVAVMFVEVVYDYKGIFGTLFVPVTRMRQEASYMVRDIRDLRASNLPGVTGTGPKSSC